MPPDMPGPTGKPVSITEFVDSDHSHDLETMRSAIVVLMFIYN